MLSMLDFLLPLTGAALVAYWYLGWNRRLPPGPTGLPLLGVAPWLAFRRRDHYFTELAKRYGEIFTVRVGFFYIVVLNSVEAVKEAFAKNEDIAGRGLRAFTKFLSDGKGIASAEGVRHREQRRYCLRVLRDFGFGKIDFEGSILDEAGHLATLIDSQAGRPFELSGRCSQAIANVIGRIVYGRRFDYDSAELDRMVGALRELNTAQGGVLLLNTTSLLDPLADWLGMGKLKAARDGIKELLVPIVEQHRAELDENNVTDFLCAYLLEQRKHAGLTDADLWDERQMMELLVDLMVAGSDTTRSTLIWAINLLSGSQVVQDAVRAELTSVIGDARSPSTSDLPRLPRLDAVIQEVFRLSALVPTAVPHCCTVDTTIFRYQLPAGTMVMANTHCLSRDPQVFANPDQFDPFGHFLATSEDGQLKVVNKDKVLPFSYGRRSCIGESLARMEIFLFLSHLLLRYRFQLPPGVTAADTMGTGALFNTCRQETFVFQRLDG